MNGNNWIIEFIKRIFEAIFSYKKTEPLMIAEEKKEEKIPELITMHELLSGYILSDQTEEVQNNLEVLHKKINQLRNKYGYSMIVTSGLRDMAHHIEIYAKKGITDKSKIPMGSQHLKGGAVDILDKDGKLYLWCKENEKFLEEIGLFLETRQGGWQHLQIAPFKSYVKGGTIWFNP